MNGGKTKKGFTIIEVMMFLAISGFLFAGIVAGAGTNISRQRYQTSVQDMAEFFRSQYSAVSSTQINPRATTDSEKIFCANTIMNNIDQSNWQWKGGGSGIDDTSLKSKDQARGRTDCLIYGRVLIFDSSGKNITAHDLLGGDYADLTEDVQLNIEKQADPTLAALKEVKVSPFVSQAFQKCAFDYSASKEYASPWGSRAELPYSNKLAQKTIIIARSPIDGAIHTYVNNTIIDANRVAGKNLLSSDGAGDNNCKNGSHIGYLAANPELLKSIFVMENSFKKEAVELCVGSEDVFAFGNNRRMIRLAKDGHNPSAVELMEQDGVRPGDDANEAMRGRPWCD